MCLDVSVTCLHMSHGLTLTKFNYFFLHVIPFSLENRTSKFSLLFFFFF